MANIETFHYYTGMFVNLTYSVLGKKISDVL